ncbi:MAG: DUF294 nucleotidyltransferase-like domain-containing protein [Deltaproteobacteria bacterium]|nr:DUF294 nucleotidyltransferase-like domain-containing protein [Deltaproteobacteria bacterium]
MSPHIPQRLREFFTAHAPFSHMRPEFLEYLGEHLVERFYLKGETITSPNDGPAQWLYIIKKGSVGGFGREDGGNDSLAWELETGEVFPLGALREKRPVHLYTKALEDTFVFCLHREGFDYLLANSPEFGAFGTRRIHHLIPKAHVVARQHSSTRLLESLPLTAPLGSIMSTPPLLCRTGDSVRSALDKIGNSGVGSIVVVDDDDRLAGIFTLRDLLPRVIFPELGMETPVGQVMTPGPRSLGPDAPVHDAVEMMARMGFTHLPVEQEGRVVGVVSERDLFSLQRVSMVQLGRTIETATSLERVARAASSIQVLIDQLLTQGVQAASLIRIITELNDNVTHRVITMIVREHEAQLPPFTWLSFGSEGRYEQTLKSDQDNGIIFVPPEGTSAEECRQSLLPLAKKINEALAKCGFTLCKGNIMAGNPECCLSLEEWKGRFKRWIDGGNPEHLLNATIFFDFRELYGNGAPVAELREWLVGYVASYPRFLRMMAENALRIAPPLGFFQDFSFADDEKHPHTINLKLAGATPIVDAARIWSLQHGVKETNTQARFMSLKEARALPEGEADAWGDAHCFLQMLRLRLQRQQGRDGVEVNNLLDPDTLNPLDRRILKEVFRQTRKLQTRLRLDFQL